MIHLKRLILFCTLVLLFNSNSIKSEVAKPILGCVHISYCRLVKEIIPNYPVEDLLPYNFAPHHFNPDISLIKILITVPELILPPKEFFPATAMIEKKRSENKNLKTFVFKLAQNESSLNKHIYSHFWFYPKSYCTFTDNLASILSGWNYKTSEDISKSKCSEIEKLVLELKNELTKKRDWNFVIDHELLVPYFNELKLTYLNLKNIFEDSGNALNSEQLKFLENSTKENKITVWITTENFSLAGLAKFQNSVNARQINLTKIDKSLLLNDSIAYIKYLIAELKRQ